jgi:hypothetical protein
MQETEMSCKISKIKCCVLLKLLIRTIYFSAKAAAAVVLFEVSNKDICIL